MGDYFIYTKLVEYMMNNTRDCIPHVDEWYLNENKDKLNDIQNKINELIEQNKEYLLNEYYLIYITRPKYHNLNLYLEYIECHLDNLLSDQKNDVLSEIYQFYDFLLDANQEMYDSAVVEHLIMYTPLDRKPMEAMNDIEELLRHLSNYKQKYRNTKNDNYEIMRIILLVIYSYSVYNKTDFHDYDEYIKYIFDNLEEYFENLELNDICKRELLSKTLDYIDPYKYMLYLDIHLNNQKKDIKGIH